ncbi:MAG: hypothetical protein QOH70_3491 [Blastocatellia bacterium]|jgi:hypothetical protein|nr:hypothetical protein [Blastocatellia bacterium]
MSQRVGEFKQGGLGLPNSRSAMRELLRLHSGSSSTVREGVVLASRRIRALVSQT